MEIDKDPKDMDKESIVKQYWEIQRLRENEENKELVLKMSQRQMRLWNYAKKSGFHTELV